MADTAITPPIDYTSRDYRSIRNDLLRLAPQFVPQWNPDTNDFATALLEMFAFVADQHHYYIDKVAAEAFLSSAVKRESVIALARMLDYYPSSAVSSTVTLTVSNTTGSTLVVPRHTVVTTTPHNPREKGIQFTTDDSLSVPGNSAASITATQGVLYTDETVATSTGLPNQQYPLFNYPVADGTIRVFVNETGEDIEWTPTQNLFDNGAKDPVWSYTENAAGITFIQFGDNTSGRIPTAGSIITAIYRTTDGISGNVSESTINLFVDTVPAGLKVINEVAATGGADAESTDLVRVSAPKSLRTLHRAVTLEDYENLAIQVQGVAKARAEATVYSSTSLYIEPSGGGSPTSDLLDRIDTFLEDKRPAGSTITFFGPVYVPINISATVKVTSRFQNNTVEKAINRRIAQYFDIANTEFGQRVRLGDIVALIQSVKGVKNVTLTLLDRGVGTDVDDVILDDEEIPVNGTVSLSISGGV